MLKIEDEEELEKRFGVDDIENALDEADREVENPNTKYYSHDEFKKIARRILDGEK